MKPLSNWWTSASLSARIIFGLCCGIFTGIFFGEPAAKLQPVADIYVRLMQMTVLPYLVTSLIVAFGQLNAEEAKRLVRGGGLLLLLVWILTAMVVASVALTFPDLMNASFYSHYLVEPRTPISFADIYFTANPFDALSRNVVPAVVLFSSLMGVGLMGLEGKERLLAPLLTANQAITRITRFIIALTPVGVFAIGAVAAGTMEPETFERLIVYFVAFAAAALLLAFWILPLLVTAVTPFRYREVSGIARDALLTAFVANNAFIVLPILIDRSKELLARHGVLDENSASAAEVMIPVLFNFPNAGKLLTLLFIPYAAWFTGEELSAVDFSHLMALGIPSYFAKAQVALPFLIDVFHLPHDLFQLYIPTTIITGKFDALVTAVNLLVFALLSAGAMGGFLILDRIRLLRAAIAIVGGLVAMVVGLSLLFAATVDTSYHLNEAVQNMHAAKRSADTVVHRELSDTGDRADARDAPTPAAIRARGSLRIGYDPDNLPMSFFNTDGDLVGLDVELGEQLAAALGVKAEFVPVTWQDVPRLLEERIIDIMPGVWFRPFWFSSVRLSDPYFFASMGLAARDERRHEFTDVEDLRGSSGLRIGVPLAANQIEFSMGHYFKGSDAEFVVVDFWKPFFEGKHPDIDAFLMPAEHASAWSLLHPQYTVVVPQPDPVLVPTAFALSPDAVELIDLVNEWVVYAANAGVFREGFDFWVAGQGAVKQDPRWSIARDVLGWID